MNVFDIEIKQERNGLVYLPNETKPFTGVFVGWHHNGQKKSEENYKDGKKDGTHTSWHYNGQKFWGGITKTIKEREGGWKLILKSLMIVGLMATTFLK
jgi:antitoxin component YwqK of YwqJK toxin-antitoxin module